MRQDQTVDLAALPGALAADRDAAFPLLVRALQDDVYSGALRLTGNRTDAEDLTQEAFVRAYRALVGYPAERVRSLRLRGWVWTIAVNLCRNRARSLARHRAEALPDPLPWPDRSAGPEEQAIGAAEGDRLAANLARLPWGMRSAVVLRHVVDLSYAEIAVALGRPEGTVKADVHRGLRRLRASMEESR